MTSTIVRTVELGSPAALPSKTRLSLADGIGFNEWRDIGHQLERIHDSSTWWLADWAAYGDERFRKDYSPALETLRPWQRSLRLIPVARRVTPDTRREQLTFFDHAAVAHLPADEQEAWLDDAEAQGWSTAQLQLEVQTASGRERQPPPLKVHIRLDPEIVTAAHAKGVTVEEYHERAARYCRDHDDPHLNPEAKAA